MTRFITTAMLLGAMTVPALSETIKLKNGDVINAAVKAEDDKSITIDHPSLGGITIAKDKIDKVYKDADAMAAAQSEQAAAEKAAAIEAERAADGGILGTGFLKGWNREVKAGVSGAEGNSQNLNFRLSFHADYEDENDRWLYDMVYRAAKSDGSTTENQFYAALTKDWLLPGEDYFYFATGQWDWDQFEDWDSRLSGFLGGGYQLLDDETWNIRGRAGVGGNQTFGGSVNSDEFTPEALFGVEADYVISDKQNITFSNYIFPSLEEFIDDFRNVTTLEYNIAIDQDKGMDLSLGMANEYDSAAPATSKKNDFTYYITLGWKF